MTHHASRTRTAFLRITLGVAIAASTAGCAARENPALDELESELRLAQADAAIARRAPSAVEDAVEAVTLARLAEQQKLDDAEIEHRIYLGHRRIDIARAQSGEKEAEEEIARLGMERERVVAESRTLDADRRATVARGQAQAAEGRALDAEARAAAERSSLEGSRQAFEAKLTELRRELDATETERGLLFTLGGDFLFDVGRSDLRSGAHQRLDRLAAFLADYPTRRIRIEGYTDSTGSDRTNLALSTARAGSVERAFIDSGIAAERIEAYGNGARSPVASNETAAGRQQNRRVEVLLRPDGASGTMSDRR